MFRLSVFVNMKPYESYFLKYVRLPAARQHLSHVQFRSFAIHHDTAEPPPSISLKTWIDRLDRYTVHQNRIYS